MADNLNVQISVAAKDLASAPLKQMESSLTSLGRTAESTSGMFGKLTASFASGAGLAAGMAGIQGIAGAFSAVGDSIIGLNANLEQNKIAFTTMLGSGEKAEKMLADLTKLAADTPFELKDLEQGTKRLLAFGFSGDQIMPMLKSLGDAAAGLGMSGSEGLNRLGLALGQMQAKGKVSAQEMMQLAEAGVPAWDILAKGIGKTTAETMNLAEKGLIPANLAIDVLTKGMEQRFPDMMAKQSQTFNGLMSTLHDTVTIGLAKMGEPIFNAMKDVLKGVVDLLSGPGLANAMTGIGTMVANAVTFITSGIKAAADFLKPFVAQAQAFAEQTGNQFAVLADLVDQALKGNIVEAIQGFLTYLGSVRDMLVERFAGWASAFLDWIGPMIPKALAQLGAFEVRMATWIIDQVQPFANNLMKWGAAFVDWLEPRVPAILAALTAMGGRLLDWITGTALPGITARLGQWAQAFTAWVQPLIPPFLSELGQLMQRFGGWLTGTALPFIAAQLGQWAQAFIDWIGPLIPPFIGRLGDLLSQFGGWLTGTALPFISDHLAEWGQAFLDWVGPMIPPLLAEAGKLLGQFGSWIKDSAAPAIADKLGEWAGKFVAWVSPMIPPLLAEVGTLLNRLVTWIKNDAVPAIADGLGYWVGKFIGWVGDVVPKLPGELSKMLTSIKDWITGEGGTGATDSAKTLGANILDGIKNGLENGVGGFFDYLGDLVKKTVQSFLGGFERGRNAGTQQVGLRIDNDSLPFGAGGGMGTSSGTFSPFDSIFRKYAGDLSNNDEFIKIVAAGTKAESTWNPNNQTGDGGHSWGLFQMHDQGAGAGMGNARLDPDAASRVMVPLYAAAFNRYSQYLSGPALAAAVAQAAERSADPTGAAYAKAYREIGSGGGLQQASFQMSNAVDTLGGNGPTIPGDVAASWDKALSGANKTEKTLAEKVQPTVDQFNKLLQTTRDRLGDIGTNAQKAFDQAADAANKAMAKARETASSQISDLYSNRDIQRSVRARTDDFQAAMEEASRSFQENQQATQQRLRRTSEDQTTVRSRAQEDADRGLSIQLSAQEVAHKRELQDKDAAHQQTVDLTEAAYQRDLDLRKATTAEQQKQIQERYAEQVESITHRAQLEQQQRAYQRAEEDAERKRQDELDAAALKRRRDEEDANLAYRRQQEDKANADQSAAQQAAEVFKRQQAAQTRAFQDGLEDEALARQVVRINQERDQRIADIQEEQKQRQAAITEQANAERDRLIRDAQERGAELATRIKEIAGADAGQFLGPLQAQLAALVGEIKTAMGEAQAAIASLPDTAAQAAQTWPPQVPRSPRRSKSATRPWKSSPTSSVSPGTTRGRSCSRSRRARRRPSGRSCPNRSASQIRRWKTSPRSGACRGTTRGPPWRPARGPRRNRPACKTRRSAASPTSSARTSRPTPTC
jgi:tape measure domain-containing protein